MLVLCGDADRLAPPACSQEIADLAPGALLEWIADCGHMLTMEKPREVSAALARWLDSLSI